MIDTVRVTPYNFKQENKLLGLISFDINLESSRSNDQVVIEEKDFTYYFFTVSRNIVFQKDLIFLFDYNGNTISAKVLET
jgi:hypothetical protein